VTDASRHLDDVLSAYLDDELTAAERAEVDAHLAACPECRSDLDAEAEVRRVLRELPAVDPPFGFYERILRDGPGVRSTPDKKRRLRFGLANIAGAAAAWLVILGVVNVNSATGSVEPVTADYVSAHASVPADLSASESPDEAAKVQANYDAPMRLAGTYQLVGLVDDNGIPQLIYTDGRRVVSMFVQAGRLNVDALPSDAEVVNVNGAQAWQVPTAQGAVVFLQRPGVVVILVGADPDQAASDVVQSGGPRADEHESLLDHVTDAGTGLLETFGFQG
jgi:anti-sigma factor (TIGR02949 family)